MQTDFNSLQCFPGNCGSASHDDVFARLGHVHTDHRVFEDGPLRQVLCLRLSIPVDGRQGMAERGCASLRLHLRDETVYGIQITGNVEFALVQIEAIAEWLRKRQYDESAFAIYERELAQLINPDLASAACSVWLERNATIDPVFGLPLNMSAKVYLATLNAFRTKCGLPSMEELPEEVKLLLASRHLPEHKKFASYRKNLDQAALAFIHDSGGMRVRRCDQLKAYNFFVGNNGAFCRNRIQAVQELHWLLPALVGVNIPSPKTVGRRRHKEAQQILDAIDEGAPLFHAVARAFGVSKETARWFRNRTLPSSWILDMQRMRLLHKLLSWIPHEKRPQCQDDFCALVDVVNMLLPVFESFSDPETSNALQNPRYGRILRRWLGELIRVDIIFARDELAQMMHPNHDLAGAKDFLRAAWYSLHRFCDYNIAEYVASEDAHLDFFLDWIGTKSLGQILKLSDRWHDALPHCVSQANISDIPLATTSSCAQAWPAVLPEPFQIESLTIVELTDHESLIEDGLIMQHCVETYHARCMLGNTIILSVRDRNGRRLSTAELLLQALPLKVVSGQHKAPQNAVAPERCREAINALVHMFNHSDRIELLKNRFHFQQAQRLHQKKMGTLTSAGVPKYNWLVEATAWLLVIGEPPPDDTVDSIACLRERVTPPLPKRLLSTIS